LSLLLSTALIAYAAYGQIFQIYEFADIDCGLLGDLLIKEPDSLFPYL
jgi:hypothetical protein